MSFEFREYDEMEMPRRRRLERRELRRESPVEEVTERHETKPLTPEKVGRS